MTDTRDTPQDPAGCLRDLRAALARPELQEFDHPEPPGEAARAASYRLAVAVGRCRLFSPPGVAIEPLRPRVALAAAEVLQRYLTDWTEDVRNLPRDWKQADPVEASDLCLGPLRARMRGWAVWLAIAETEAVDPLMSAAIDQVQSALNRFDHELQEQVDLLSVAANTNLLDNWRTLLVDPWRDELPWWLDGTLEDAARRLEESALASQPDETVGYRLRHAILGWLPRPLSFAAAEQHEPEYLPPLRWRSRDGNILARLEVPTVCGEDESVVVTFEPAGTLGIPKPGTPVWLASVPSEIHDGKASFRIGDLYAAGRAPALEVGEARIPLIREDH
jgi:hypothetical protein